MPETDWPNLTFFCDNERHLVCLPYSVENLHKMADYFGLKRHWFHRGKTGLHHYDIPKKRIAEITASCILVSTREIVRICKDA